MSDDKNNIGGRDRATVAAGEDYEVQDFARANRVTPERVRDLIRRFGNDRETLTREAKRLSGS